MKLKFPSRFLEEEYMSLEPETEMSQTCLSFLIDVIKESTGPSISLNIINLNVIMSMQLDLQRLHCRKETTSTEENDDDEVMIVKEDFVKSQNQFDKKYNEVKIALQNCHEKAVLIPFGALTKQGEGSHWILLKLTSESASRKFLISEMDSLSSKKLSGKDFEMSVQGKFIMSTMLIFFGNKYEWEYESITVPRQQYNGCGCAMLFNIMQQLIIYDGETREIKQKPASLRAELRDYIHKLEQSKTNEKKATDPNFSKIEEMFREMPKIEEMFREMESEYD